MPGRHESVDPRFTSRFHRMHVGFGSVLSPDDLTTREAIAEQSDDVGFDPFGDNFRQVVPEPFNTEMLELE